MRWLLYLLAIGAAIVAIISLWRRKEPITAMTEMVTGVIQELPADEAARKGLDVETLSLARAMQSEVSGENPRLAVGYSAKRHAARLGISITKLVTTTSKKKDGTHAFPEVLGHYSEQRFAKYCSTFQAPTAHTLELAQQVRDGTATDPSQGAELWDNPLLQTALAMAHPYNEETHHGYKTPDVIAEERKAHNYSEVTVEGTTTRFWART
jgi:hypothetical protein